MAVAIHIGKTSTMSYVHKDFEANDWDLYQCWIVLRSHRAFLPPSTATEENTVELDEAIEETGNEDTTSISTNKGNGSDTANATTNTAPTLATTTPMSARSRGPGAGAKKTRANAANEDYKKKKAKIQEGILEVQRDRQNSFNAYVKNHARNKAFEMAALGYKTFKDSDPEEAAKYKFHIQNILHKGTPADGSDSSDDEGMPSLGV